MKLDIQLATNGIITYQAHASTLGTPDQDRNRRHQWSDSHRNTGTFTAPADASMLDLAQLVLNESAATDAQRAVDNAERQSLLDSERAAERAVRAAARIPAPESADWERNEVATYREIFGGEVVV